MDVRTVALNLRRSADAPLPGSRSPRDPARQIPAGNHGLAPDEVIAIQRDRLIDAFVQVIGERGYPGVAIDLVCKRAGVSTKAFYKAFRDLDDLFVTTYDLGKEALFNRATAAYRTGGPAWQGRVRAALESILVTLADNPDLARLCIVEAGAAGPVGHERVMVAIRESCSIFAGATPTVPSPRPFEEMLPLIIGGIFTRIYFQILEGRTRELPALLDSLTYFALLPFVGPEQASATHTSRAGTE
ncbi:MAG: TetR/AcrR family transcriptional regulator [Acidimicrobiia bacterium]